jgi:hypothetical protein
LKGFPNRAGDDQLAALLGPDTVTAGEDPRRRPGLRVVLAHDGGVAVGRQRNGLALLRGDPAGAGQLRPLLRELRQR